VGEVLEAHFFSPLELGNNEALSFSESADSIVMLEEADVAVEPVVGSEVSILSFLLDSFFFIKSPPYLVFTRDFKL
jgi:hypothetical protein